MGYFDEHTIYSPVDSLEFYEIFTVVALMDFIHDLNNTGSVYFQGTTMKRIFSSVVTFMDRLVVVAHMNLMPLPQHVRDRLNSELNMCRQHASRFAHSHNNSNNFMMAQRYTLAALQESMGAVPTVAGVCSMCAALKSIGLQQEQRLAVRKLLLWTVACWQTWPIMLLPTLSSK